MKILRPVDAEKRKPDPENGNSMFTRVTNTIVSGIVIIRYRNKKIPGSFSSLTLAYFNHTEQIWENAAGDSFFKDHCYQVIEWFEEIEIESLFPNENLSYQVAQAACKSSDRNIAYHQEGQIFLKNHLLKELKK